MFSGEPDVKESCVSRILLFSWCFTSTETIRFIRDREKIEGGGIIYLSLRCHHQNDSCINMGSDQSHFNASLIVRDKVTRQCPQTTTFEEKGEPKRIRTEVPLLTSLTPYRNAKPAHVSCCGQHVEFICRHNGRGPKRISM